MVSSKTGIVALSGTGLKLCIFNEMRPCFPSLQEMHWIVPYLRPWHVAAVMKALTLLSHRSSIKKPWLVDVESSLIYGATA